MTPADTHIARWLELIRAEYREMPGLQLTGPQARRLWGLDDITCSALLTRLLNTKFLTRNRSGAYISADRH